MVGRGGAGLAVGGGSVGRVEAEAVRSGCLVVLVGANSVTVSAAAEEEEQSREGSVSF